jgi:uncharacterized protein YegJ (DUF2314 family)
MSDEPSIVFKFDNSDPQIQNAYAKARDTFRYFYRELHWEARRIIPGLSVASIKAPFSDPVPPESPQANDAAPDEADTYALAPDEDDDAETADGSAHPDVEHMWVNELTFDGRTIRGKLLNTPNWLKSFQAGDDVEVPLENLSDWMYVIGDTVYGAFTVQMMRLNMNPAERRRHDEAWGLDFGDPNVVKLVPEPQPPKPRNFLQRLFGSKPAPPPTTIGEHPMSINVAPAYREQLTANPVMLDETHDRGWTLLHQESLAGSAPTVQVLLELGANPNIKAEEGSTPLDLAKRMRWEKVVALLEKAAVK